jgi:hypothetical protein
VKFLNNIFDAMEARRRREDRIAAMIFGGGCLTFIILGMIIVIVTTILNTVETAKVNSAYGDAYASACQPVPSGNESVDNLTDAVPPRRILLLTSDTKRRHEWYSDLPEPWRAENEEEVDLIGCVADDQILLETCEYLRDSARADEAYTVSISREQNQTTLVLINPQTARRIDSLTIAGSEPDACPEDDGSLVSGEQRGEEVKWVDFASWLETYVFDR